MRNTARFCRQWAIALDGGIPVRQSLALIAAPGTPWKIRRAAQCLEASTQDGATLSQAIQEHPRTFPSYFGTMLCLGERAGRLEGVVERLADHYEVLLDLHRLFVQQCAYPFAVFLGIMIGVPILKSILSTLVMDNSHLLTTILWILYYGLRPLVVAAAVNAFVGHVTPLRRFVLTILLHIWPFGLIIRRRQLARFYWALDLLTAVGYPLYPAVVLASQTVEAKPMAKSLRAAAEGLRNNRTLAESLATATWLPKRDRAYIEIGEVSGRLTEMFQALARQRSEESLTWMRNGFLLVEGLLILNMGLFYMGGFMGR